MISINATLVVQLINFLVLIWILNKILFRPILKIMTEREKSIQDAKKNMENLRVEADEKARIIEERLHKARKAASVTADEVRKEASAQAKDIIGRAQAQAQTYVADVQAEAEKQADQVRQSMSEYKDAIVEMIFLKVMGRNVT